MPDIGVAIETADAAEKLGIVGILVAVILIGGSVVGVATRILYVLYRDAQAKLASERDEWDDERKAHAAELKSLNDKRIEDVERVLAVMGTFNEGRKAIATPLEQLSNAIEKIAQTHVSIGERVLELKFDRRTKS